MPLRDVPDDALEATLLLGGADAAVQQLTRPGPDLEQGPTAAELAGAQMRVAARMWDQWERSTGVRLAELFGSNAKVAGFSTSEVANASLNIAQGSSLDALASAYGITRMAFSSQTGCTEETDAALRERLKKLTRP
jgi:hypothetical protein